MTLKEYLESYNESLNEDFKSFWEEKRKKEKETTIDGVSLYDIIHHPEKVPPKLKEKLIKKAKEEKENAILPYKVELNIQQKMLEIFKQYPEHFSKEIKKCEEKIKQIKKTIESY